MTEQNGLSTFAGYLLLRRLPGGGAVESYVARKPSDARRVLLRLVTRTALGGAAGEEAFFAEARRRQTLAHPGLASVLELGVRDERCFVASEYVEGTTLAQLLRTLRDAGMRMPAPLAIEIIVRLCQATDYVWTRSRDTGSPVSPPDLEPQAVLIGIGGEVKLQATSMSGDAATPATSSGTVARRFRYHAPEQIHDNRVTARSNVFSLGVMLYELLAGYNPFARTSPLATIEALTREDPPLVAMTGNSLAPLEPVLALALAKRPEERYASPAQLGVALQTILDAGSLGRRDLALGSFVARLIAGGASLDSDWLAELSVVTDDAATSTLGGLRAAALPAESGRRRAPTPPGLLWPLLYATTVFFVATLTLAVGRELRAPAPAVVSPPSPVTLRRDGKQSFGALEILTLPAMPVFADSKRADEVVDLRDAKGKVTIGSSRHPFVITVRYHLLQDGLHYELDARPWALIQDQSGASLGRTPITDVTAPRSDALRLTHPPDGRQATLTLKFSPE